MKQKVKIVLDIVMLLMTLTLFSKRFFGMIYHELAGIGLIAVVIIHIALNIKTVTAMIKKFVRIPAAVKTGLIVDILLLLCFGWLGISGILSSHTILTEISSESAVFKLTHMFAGGASVILLGVHIGLHIYRKPIPIIAAIILTVAVFGGGIYGAANSSMGRWLSIPYSMAVQSGGAGGSEHISSESGSQGVGANSAKQGGKHQNQSEGKQQGSNSGRKNSVQLSLAEKVQNIIMFLGMILSCAMITYWTAVPKKKIHRQTTEN